jgi:hypothetical protein
MMMRRLAGGSMVPIHLYPTVQSRKLISGLNFIGRLADFTCVRFGIVMHEGVSWCVTGIQSCQWNSESAVFEECHIFERCAHLTKAG